MALLPELITYIVDLYLDKDGIDAIRTVEEYKGLVKNYSNIVIDIDQFNDITEIDFIFKKISFVWGRLFFNYPKFFSHINYLEIYQFDEYFQFSDPSIKLQELIIHVDDHNTVNYVINFLQVLLN